MDLIKLLKELILGKKLSTKTRLMVKNALNKCTQVYTSDDINAKKSLIIELDGVLGKALGDLYGKNSVAENLKKAGLLVHKSTYQKAWDAHKVRNILAHEPDAALSNKDLNIAIDNFRVFLKAIST